MNILETTRSPSRVLRSPGGLLGFPGVPLRSPVDLQESTGNPLKSAGGMPTLGISPRDFLGITQTSPASE